MDGFRLAVMGMREEKQESVNVGSGMHDEGI